MMFAYHPVMQKGANGVDFVPKGVWMIDPSTLAGMGGKFPAGNIFGYLPADLAGAGVPPMLPFGQPIQMGFMQEEPTQLRKLFIGGLNHETTDDQLRDYYSQWGTVVDCIVIRDPVTKHSRGFGFVTYSTIKMAELAMAERPHTINGKVVDPKRAIPREHMLPLTPNNPPHFLEAEPPAGCKITLTGIHWDYHTVDGLRQHFEKFGNVEQVEIVGHPRGFGFVVFEDKVSADKCLQSGKSHLVNGRRVEVKENVESNPPPQQQHRRHNKNSPDRRRGNFSSRQHHNSQSSQATSVDTNGPALSDKDFPDLRGN
uniref:RNA-binding protein n=2 Tax=Bursaphelenchus xylophilus TaxID=6326 RepID=A0A1I7SSP5_BURXY